MITAVNDCGCIAPSPNSKSKARNSYKDDEEKCPCPRPGQSNYDSMIEKCSPCCAGVFPEKKNISEIVEGGKPYKEIEAVINDNKMVIRIQKESVKNDWDPPCDCVEDSFGDFEKRNGRLGGGGCGGCGNNVVFQKSDNFDDRQSMRDEKNPCRTVTVLPEVEILANDKSEGDNNERKDKKEKIEKFESNRIVDLEENPNIFVLRIRKRNDNLDGKNNIDIEFRTPRPWINLPKIIPKISTSKQSTSIIKVEKKSTKGKGKGKKNKGKK